LRVPALLVAETDGEPEEVDDGPVVVEELGEAGEVPLSGPLVDVMIPVDMDIESLDKLNDVVVDWDNACVVRDPVIMAVDGSVFEEET
jgi:hypothetical protein